MEFGVPNPAQNYINHHIEEYTNWSSRFTSDSPFSLDCYLHFLGHGKRNLEECWLHESKGTHWYYGF